MRTIPFHVICITLLAATVAHAADYPPPTTEINAERPLFIFNCAAADGETPESYAARLESAWTTLPEKLKPNAALLADVGPIARASKSREVLAALGDSDLRLVLRAAMGFGDTADSRISPKDVAAFLSDHPRVAGIDVTGLEFNTYDTAMGEPPEAAWLGEVIEAAANYGRFSFIALDELHWPRLMSNLSCAPLYDKIRNAKDYVIPANWTRGPHHPARHGAVMGLWLEDAASRWGMAIDPRWYSDAHFIRPGIFGAPGNAVNPPPSLYRAMMLIGAMSGASVYSFAQPTHLWFGAAHNYWEEAIAPTVESLLDAGLIPRKEFVAGKARLAYQLAPSVTPLDFHENLKDIDGVYDKGHMIQGVYGMERPGQIPELIPNNPGAYWVPILSYHASDTALEYFGMTVTPGRMGSADDWAMIADRYRDAAAAEGQACVVRVGRGIFVLNSHENTLAPQRYRLEGVPAPVREFNAERNDGDVLLRWPYREGDISYQVYRRVLPAQSYTKIASGLDRREYTDAGAGTNESVAYAITALTSEKEPASGIVSPGEYLTYSTVESRIAEEALLTPLLARAISQPLRRPPTPDTAAPWWPNLEGLAPDEQAMARAIAERIATWDQAIVTEDLSAVLNLYHTTYEDPQGWGFQYARRAYQWLFERYQALRMHRQVRRWDFSQYPASGRVSCLLYCRITGIALTDTSGRIADLPISIPRTQGAEVWVTWTDQDGFWRIANTNPALPNFADLLSYAAGPYDNFQPGPDIYQKQ